MNLVTFEQLLIRQYHFFVFFFFSALCEQSHRRGASCQPKHRILRCRVLIPIIVVIDEWMHVKKFGYREYSKSCCPFSPLHAINTGV